MANNSTYKDEVIETCLSMEELVTLAKGEADELLRARAHQHMESCDLCRDAFEGLTAGIDPDAYREAVKDINQRIDQSTIVSDIKYKKSRPMLLFSAAAVLLVFIIASLFIFVFRDQKKGNLAKNEITEEQEVLAQEAGNEEKKENEGSSTDAAEQKTAFENLAPVEMTADVMEGGEGDEQDLMNDNVSERNAEPVAKEEELFDYSAANKQAINENLVVNEAKSGGYVIASKSKKSENKKGVAGAPLTEDQDDVKDKNLDENYMKQAYVNLESQNYLSALYFSKLILDRDPTNREAQLLAGISNYYLGNYAASDKQLEGVIEAPSDSLSFEGMWFLSNSMVKQNKIEQAEQMLQKLASEKNHYRKDAADLLESIKK